MIKLKCQHCKYLYSVSEEELQDNRELHKYCFICGGLIEVINLDEIIRKDIDTEVIDNINSWFKIFGIEATIELIFRHKYLAVFRLYEEELKRRGLIK